MDWLAKLPLVGPYLVPLVRRAMRTHAFRAYRHYSDRNGNRLAGAVTYFAFLSLFPMIAVGSAVGAAVLSSAQLATLQHKLAAQIPGIADRLDVGALSQNAGTIGVIGLLGLVYSGLGGVSVARTSVRAVWEVPEEPGNPIVRKLLDLGVMVGLGIAFAVTLGGSALATAAAGRVADWLRLSATGPGQALLTVLGYAIAVAASFALFCYLLTWLPMVRPPRRAVLTGALIGAVGFEALKILLSGYLTKVAAKGVYGAFGVPIALLLWINFASRLLLLCAAWTATAPDASPARDDRLTDGAGEDGDSGNREGDVNRGDANRDGADGGGDARCGGSTAGGSTAHRAAGGRPPGR